jgi:8-oxo-dGTP pyrophosphatase MutT (NUDIX family)
MSDEGRGEQGAAPDPAGAEVRVPTLAQIEAAVAPHVPTRYPDLGRSAAVLVPLLPRPDGVHLLFTKRSERLATHSGQVSFPGGSVDPTDQSVQRAALREAQEEVGLDPAHVRLLGQLDDVPTFVTGFVISPIVGVVDARWFTEQGRYPWAPSPHEIDTLHELPLAEFCEPRNSRIETREARGSLYQLYWFTVRGTTVWGATARILQSLIELSLGLPSSIARPIR